MKQSTLNFVSNVIHLIRCCPFCSASAHLTFKGLNPVSYGVQCRSCGASIPATHINGRDAIQAWNRRSGLAAVGGRATKGIVSDKKLRACRANLAKAREARQVHRLRPKLEATFATLRSYRQRELADAQAALAESRAELAALAPRIRKSPLLSNFLDWIRARQRLAEEDF